MARCGLAAIDLISRTWVLYSFFFKSVSTFSRSLWCFLSTSILWKCVYSCLCSPQLCEVDCQLISNSTCFAVVSLGLLACRQKTYPSPIALLSLSHPMKNITRQLDPLVFARRRFLKVKWKNLIDSLGNENSMFLYCFFPPSIFILFRRNFTYLRSSRTSEIILLNFDREKFLTKVEPSLEDRNGWKSKRYFLRRSTVKCLHYSFRFSLWMCASCV